MRRFEGKKLGYIIVPVIIDEASGDPTDDAYDQIITVLQALATEDDRIIDWFRAKRGGRSSVPNIIEIEIDEKVALSINLADFTHSIETRIWKRVARLSWLPFPEAMANVRALGLKNNKQWRAYCRGERADLPQRRLDIPANPDRVYENEFLESGGWGAWLGSGRRHHKDVGKRSYVEAREFVAALGLKSQREWYSYCRGERADLPPRPSDIPISPPSHYRKAFRENGGWGTWLGTGVVAPQLRSYRGYDEAVRFIHTLRLENELQWREYCKGKRNDLPPKPKDIPANPNVAYSEKFYECGGMGAWLGTGTVASHLKTYRTYDEATKFVHGLHLRNQEEWNTYCRGKRSDLPSRPTDIPTNPYRAYSEEFSTRGGMGAWLGTGRRVWGADWTSYEDAVKFVHKLGLKSAKEWREYCNGSRPDLPPKPNDISASPYFAYSEEFSTRGGMGAWLGTGPRE